MLAQRNEGASNVLHRLSALQLSVQKGERPLRSHYSASRSGVQNGDGKGGALTKPHSKPVSIAEATWREGSNLCVVKDWGRLLPTGVREEQETELWLSTSAPGAVQLVHGRLLSNSLVLGYHLQIHMSGERLHDLASQDFVGSLKQPPWNQD